MRAKKPKKRRYAHHEGLQPAAGIINKLGGKKAVAEATGLSETTVYNWTYPPEIGGTGGTIPLKHHRLLREFARSRGIRLRYEELQPIEERAA